ncbi:MAG: J domain-containing protein, partial [Clostridia bacterium]|nr:J domain-containing protein [Clostridia bacterium]
MENYYVVLEVNNNASLEVIKMAYKALVKKYHPDTTTFDKQEAHERMIKINEAYAVLSDSKKRKEYDDYLKAERKKYSNTSKNDNGSNSKSRYNPNNDSYAQAYEALIINAQIACEMGDFQKAKQLCDEYIRLFPNDERVHICNLLIHHKLHNEKELAELDAPFDDTIYFSILMRFSSEDT